MCGGVGGTTGGHAGGDSTAEATMPETTMLHSRSGEETTQTEDFAGFDDIKDEVDPAAAPDAESEYISVFSESESPVGGDIPMLIPTAAGPSGSRVRTFTLWEQYGIDDDDAETDDVRVTETNLDTLGHRGKEERGAAGSATGTSKRTGLERTGCVTIQ